VLACAVAGPGRVSHAVRVAFAPLVAVGIAIIPWLVAAARRREYAAGMASALPPRPRLGRRERWLLVAVVLTVGEGIAGHFGVAAEVEHVTITLGAIIAFVAGDSYRATGTARQGRE